MSEYEHPIPQEGLPRPEARTDLARLPFLWDAIYGRAPGYLSLLSGRRADRDLGDVRERFYRVPADVAQAVDWIRREAEAGRELYQGSHLLTEPRRRKEAAAPLASLYADLDTADVSRGMLEPTVLVESSPGKLQGYWRLTHPVAPRLGEELNRRLAYTFGADKSGWDLTQLLRIPGTRNHKYPDTPLVRVLAITDARYDPDVLTRLLAPLPPRPDLAPRSQLVLEEVAPAGEPPVWLSRPGRAVWAGQDVKLTPDGRVDRSSSLMRIARVLFEAGLRGSALATALAERDSSLGWHKYSGRDDAAAQYQAIVAFVERGSRTRRRG